MHWTFGYLLMYTLVLGVFGDSNSTLQENRTVSNNDTRETKSNETNPIKVDVMRPTLASEQQRLLEHLFRNYDKNVRPAEEPNRNLSIRIQPSVRQIVEINERQQVLTLYFWLRIYWYDKNFVWNEADFSNIKNFNVEADKMWLPDLSLYNSAQEGQDALIYHKIKTKVQVSSDGACRWLSPYFSSTSCNIDSTHFPFDEQKCQVEMASWTATGNVIDVVLDKNLSIDTSQFLENIQWKIQSVSAYKQVKFYGSNTHPYPSLVFEFVLRRRSLFYIINLIFPCVILSFLSLMTFYIPPASGERITLSISLLLTMLFTLYIVTENLPPDSTTVPLLTKFIGVAMLIMTLSLFGTSVAIKFEGKAEPVPKWVALFVGKYLGCLVLRNTSWVRKCAKKRRQNPEEMALNLQTSEENQKGFPDPEDATQVDNGHPTCRHRSPQSSWNNIKKDSGESTAAHNTSSPVMSSIVKMFQHLSSRVEKKALIDEAQGEWKEIGSILNTLFFGTFFAVLFISTIVIFSGARYTE
ncbi:neuronal acetylcholine receptor subunit alpha-9-like [Dendronephthya gigantea]|uniref:neuronal acetylcholine receptor subunit alpha-9-like n=1 Tax=Dendronephthya gigantea TaxID=151771 RepID=UPI00106CF6EF|nr:neuronal acetylcholine receptor subunit alpha-9-like [Dendronephthya gigantea]